MLAGWKERFAQAPRLGPPSSAAHWVPYHPKTHSFCKCEHQYKSNLSSQYMIQPCKESRTLHNSLDNISLTVFFFCFFFFVGKLGCCSQSSASRFPHEKIIKFLLWLWATKPQQFLSYCDSPLPHMMIISTQTPTQKSSVTLVPYSIVHILSNFCIKVWKTTTNAQDLHKRPIHSALIDYYR